MRAEPQSAARLQHREQHRQAAAVPADHRAARRAAGLGASSACTSTSTGRVPSSPANTALPGDVAAPLGEEQRRRVGDLGQAALGHLEHADLVGGAEAVLHRAQDAELMAAVAFEIQHGVHHVLQHARPGDGALLGDVADQDQGECRAFASRISSKLEARTCATVPGALSIVSSHMVWIESITTSAASPAASRLAAMSRRLIAAASSSGASCRPRRRARRRICSIDSSPEMYRTRRPSRARRGRRLQQQGRLADARIAADQHRRGRHEAAAQHAVELGDAGGARGGGSARAGETDEGDTPARTALGGGTGTRGDRFLDDGVPLAAGFAAAGPLRADGAAALADEAGGRLGQWASGAIGGQHDLATGCVLHGADQQPPLALAT